MKIALAQLELSSNINDNFVHALKSIEEAASKDARLICFPEVQLSPFFPQYPSKDASMYVLEIDDEKIKKLQEYSKKFKIAVVPNIYLKEEKNYYDASLVINSEGNILGISKMVHICQKPFFYEQDYYTPSNAGFKVYDVGSCKLGVVVCFDRHYPESIRSCVLQGAELIIIPTANIFSENLELFEWEIRIPAMQNNVYIAMCNRVGIEDKMHFCGQSIVVDPNGNVITKADDKEQIVYANLDFNSIQENKNKKHYLGLRNKTACSI